MTEENTINQEMLEIVKALSAKVESLERTLYAKDNILMKAGLVVAESPSPLMDNSTTSINVDDMDWSDIHKMVEKAGGQ
tara:strand:+ start:3163 stop:3399 length:237 start_codon:yes stop_codon:yes gene_type:complete